MLPGTAGITVTTTTPVDTRLGRLHRHALGPDFDVVEMPDTLGRFTSVGYTPDPELFSLSLTPEGQATLFILDDHNGLEIPFDIDPSVLAKVWAAVSKLRQDTLAAPMHRGIALLGFRKAMDDAGMRLTGRGSLTWDDTFKCHTFTAHARD